MKVTAKEIIKMAKSFVGVKESPANSNNVIFNTDYYGRNVYGSSYPWCMVYVWDIFQKCNAKELFIDGGKSASCTYVMNWYKKKGKFYTSKAKEADIVIFKWKTSSPQHTGFFLCDNGNGTFQSIEGNTGIGNDSNGGEVMIRTRYYSQVIGFCRPDYSEEKPNPTPSYTHTDFVKELQKAIGANVDGIAGPETLSKTPTLSRTKNYKHKAVTPVQKYLNSIGFDCGSADGIAGYQFDKAVKAYQKANNCEADGEITAKQMTWKCLLKLNK